RPFLAWTARPSTDRRGSPPITWVPSGWSRESSAVRARESRSFSNRASTFAAGASLLDWGAFTDPSRGTREAGGPSPTTSRVSSVSEDTGRGSKRARERLEHVRGKAEQGPRAQAAVWRRVTRAQSCAGPSRLFPHFAHFV